MEGRVGYKEENGMANTVGCRIFDTIDRPDLELVEAFRDIPTSNINDTMNRLYNTNASIKRYNPKAGNMLGIAVTVKAPLGDNVAFHRAMDLAQKGDVLVVDGGGCTERSLAGEMMMRYSQLKGIAGWVVDGALRDLGGLMKCSMPIYCKGITPQGPYKNGPGEINVPVCCGGVAVMPGDIVVGDEDGVVFIRKEDAPLILEAARKKLASEEKKIKEYEENGLQGNKHCEQWEAICLKLGLTSVHEV